MLNLNEDAILVIALEPASTKDRCSWKGLGVEKANHQGGQVARTGNETPWLANMNTTEINK